MKKGLQPTITRNPYSGFTFHAITKIPLMKKGLRRELGSDYQIVDYIYHKDSPDEKGIATASGWSCQYLLSILYHKDSPDEKGIATEEEKKE